MKTNLSGAACAAFLFLAAALPSSAANTTTAPSQLRAKAACSLLTPAQISAAVGTQVSNGTPSTDTVCTWTATSDTAAVRNVTLTLNTIDDFNGNKTLASMPAMSFKLTPVKVPGSDEAYYLSVGEQVGLAVKKGAGAFKVAVYATVPLAKKESMELPLAQTVAAKF